MTGRNSKAWKSFIPRLLVLTIEARNNPKIIDPDTEKNAMKIVFKRAFLNSGSFNTYE